MYASAPVIAMFTASTPPLALDLPSPNTLPPEDSSVASAVGQHRRILDGAHRHRGRIHRHVFNERLRLRLHVVENDHAPPIATLESEAVMLFPCGIS